jgi:hypothetical protein
VVKLAAYLWLWSMENGWPPATWRWLATNAGNIGMFVGDVFGVVAVLFTVAVVASAVQESVAFARARECLYGTAVRYGRVTLPIWRVLWWLVRPFTMAIWWVVVGVVSVVMFFWTFAVATYYGFCPALKVEP